MSKAQGISSRHWPKGSKLVLLVVLLLSLASSVLPNSVSANPETKTTVYFLRHAEDSPGLVRTGGSNAPADPYTYTEDYTGGCLVRPLNVLGLERAVQVGDFFERRGIADTLNYVIATHKVRTQQTVQQIAAQAELSVTQIPSGDECNFGTGFADVGQPTIDFIRGLPLGSVVVAANHSNNLYPIMRAFGIDTSDPVKFPKSGDTVVGYNNFWIVKIDASGAGELDDHVVLDLVIDGRDYRPCRNRSRLCRP